MCCNIIKTSFFALEQKNSKNSRSSSQKSILCKIVHIIRSRIGGSSSAVHGMAEQGKTRLSKIGWPIATIGAFVLGERVASGRAEAIIRRAEATIQRTATELEADINKLRHQLANLRSGLDDELPDPDAHAQTLPESAGVDESSGTNADCDDSDGTLIDYVVPSTGFLMGLLLGVLVTVRSYSSRERRGRS